MDAEFLYALLFATDTMLIQVDDKEKIVKAVNTRLLDYEPNELLGKSLQILLSPAEQDALDSSGSTDAEVMRKNGQTMPCAVVRMGTNVYAFCSRVIAKTNEQLIRQQMQVPVLQARLQSDRDRLRTRVATISIGTLTGLVASLMLASSSGRLSNEQSNNIKDILLLLCGASATAISGIFASPSSSQAPATDSGKEP